MHLTFLSHPLSTHMAIEYIRLYFGLCLIHQICTVIMQLKKRYFTSRPLKFNLRFHGLKEKLNTIYTLVNVFADGALIS